MLESNGKHWNKFNETFIISVLVIASCSHDHPQVTIMTENREDCDFCKVYIWTSRTGIMDVWVYFNFFLFISLYIVRFYSGMMSS